MHPRVSLAYFVSPHGFGHAARATAVMEASYDRWPFVRFEIFGKTPAWFFADGLSMPHSCHEMLTDIGMVQHSSLKVDIEKTVAALDAFLPFDERQVEALAARLHDMDCRAVICDISPMGIAAGKRAGLPTVLVENFTWDWIYRGYQTVSNGFKKYIDYLADIFDSADDRIQLEPSCRHADCVLRTPPAARRPKTPAADVRHRLGVDQNRQMVLITMGGIPENHGFLDALQHVAEDVHFVIPGPYPDLPVEGKRCGRATFLPHRSAFYHPDLVCAADAVVGKAGYSTVSEVYHAGVAFGYVTRPDFRESDHLAAFVEASMPNVHIPASEFASGKWLDRLPELLAQPKNANPAMPNGADHAAAHICRRVTQADELLEVVDSSGQTRGAAPRCRVHGDNQLLHRVVHVLVRDAQHRLLLQKRSMNKSVAAGKWDTSVGGHVDCGESVEQAVFRETAEELGIRPDPLEFAYQYIHSNDHESELVFTYVCRYEGQIRYNPEEIETVAFWAPEEIEAQLDRQVLSDNFKDEFQRYRSWCQRANANGPE